MEIIKPHFNKSKEVGKKDVPIIEKAIVPMMNLCKELEKKTWDQVFALAHCQVNNKPLRFFVFNSNNKYIDEFLGTKGSEVIINPRIVSHVKFKDTKQENCVSFPGESAKNVQRYTKIEIEYQDLLVKEDNSLFISDKKRMSCTGVIAQIFQHQIDHFNAKYIYSKEEIDLWNISQLSSK